MSIKEHQKTMSEEGAKAILRKEGPPVNIAEHIEALHVAVQKLGESCTMKDIWEWAERGEDHVEEVI